MSKLPRRKPSTLTDAEKQRLVTDIQNRNRAEGVPVKVLAEQAGITGAIFYNWLRRLGATPPPAAAVERPRVGESYSSEARARLVEVVKAHQARGETLDEACRAAGVARTTYSRWVRPAPTPATCRPVALAPEGASLALTVLAPPPAPVPPAPANLVLVTPGGYRLEGVSVEAALRLLQGLAGAAC